MELTIEGQNAPNLTRDLRDWLRREGVDGLQIDLAPGTPVPGTQGIELVTTLLVLLKTKFATEVVSSIKTWLSVRRPKVKLVFKSGNKQLTLDTENTVIDEKFVQTLKELMAATER